jgi:hypothetical protein
VKYLRFVVLFLMLALVGLGANGGCGCPGPTPAGLGKITGYVASSVLATTRIPGATVIAVGGGKTYTTVTDDQGNYTLFVQAGTYDVSASKETFNTRTQSGITVNTDETKTVNFSLTTGSGGTTEISVSYLGVVTITHPSQFDIRNIRLDKNLKPDIKSLLDSFPSNIRTDLFDYKSALIIIAGFDPSPPLGTQGSRIYVGTSPNGPFILKSLGPGVVTSMPQSILFNSIDTLNPNNTYYIYPSLYGSWGENMPEEYMEVYTPDELVLIEPENNAEVYEGEGVIFEWTGLGTEEEGWSYDGEIRTESGESVLDFNTDDTSSPVVVPYGSAGNYLWRVIGSRFSSNAPVGLSRPDDGMSYGIGEISISYPRKLIIEPAPAD